MNRAQTACGLRDPEKLEHALMDAAKMRAAFLSTLL
jgi:hypothetical protein